MFSDFLATGSCVFVNILNSTDGLSLEKGIRVFSTENHALIGREGNEKSGSS